MPDATAEFEALLAPVLERAYGVALRLTRDASDAEDLVQDAALLALRGFGTFRRGTNFRAWFLRILTNAFISGKRRHRAEDTAVSLDEPPNAYLQRRAIDVAHQQPEVAVRDAAGDVVRTVLGRITADEVAAAIDALPEEFRVVSTLYFLEDLSYQEIAEMVGVPIGTVRSRLHRGRALLQQRLWRMAEDHGIVPRPAAPEAS
jgi:RNA polymerase sigma-70 factor (ECF subfamily)